MEGVCRGAEKEQVGGGTGRKGKEWVEGVEGAEREIILFCAQPHF